MAIIINKSLTLLKLHYFFFFGGLACVMSFLPVYCGQFGLSKPAITLIYTVLPFTVVLTKPLGGNIADWLQAHKSVFLVSILLTTVFYYLINFVPEISSPKKNVLTNLKCTVEPPMIDSCSDKIVQQMNNASDLPSISCRMACDFNFTTNYCNFVPNVSVEQGWQINILPEYYAMNSSKNYSHVINSCAFIPKPDFNLLSNLCNSSAVSCEINCSCLKTEEAEMDILYYSAEFILFFALMILSLDSAGIAISLGDTNVSNIIQELNADFGCQRVFGTLGWGLLSIIAGQIFDVASVGLEKTNYSIGFHMLFGILLVDFLICFQIKVVNQPKPVKIYGSILKLYKNPEICLFTFAVFIIGMLTGTLWTFLFVYVDEMGKNPLLLGLISGVQCFGGELPFFLISGWIVKKLGHLFCMSVCLICFGVRFIYYSLITNQWLVLPMEVSNGITFGIFFATMVSFASVKSPPGMTATMQSILQAFFEGLGLGIGNLITGVLYTYFGGKKMFFIMGTSSLVIGVLYTIAVIILKRMPQNRAKQTKNESQEMKTLDATS